MKNIAFVSLGNQSKECADILVKSIKKNNSNCRIIQISTEKDRDVIGVDEKLIYNFKSATFMLNRLESQIKIVEQLQKSIDLLATIIKEPKSNVATINVTKRIEQPSEEARKKFTPGG